MKICWVTNDKYYSKLLRYLFTNETSHVGMIFNLNTVSLAVDINRPYGTVWDSHYWLHRYNNVWTMEIELNEEDELSLYHVCNNYCVLREYDMGAYYYGMLMGLRLKFLGLPLPTVNKWSKNTGSTCQEIVVPIVQNEIIRHIEPRIAKIDPKIFANCTPDMTITVMKNATKNNPRIKWIYHG